MSQTGEIAIPRNGAKVRSSWPDVGWRDLQSVNTIASGISAERWGATD